MGKPPRLSTLILATLPLATLSAGAGACAGNPSPSGSYGARIKAEFRHDRERCQRTAERIIPYVDPRDGDAVATRSFRVEGEIQRCMLSRGWNNPEHGGWRKGRS